MNALARIADVSGLTVAQVELIRSQIAPKATPDELALFVSVAKSKGLDPLSKEIYAIHRGGKMTIQLGIDGLRGLAERSGEYAGNDDPRYVEDEHGLVSATATVWRLIQGQRVAFSATARWKEYAQQESPMWKRMPYLMLGKCSEALALRKAFPAALSGLYTPEEMSQAGPADKGTAEGWIDVPPPEPVPAKVEPEKRRAKKAEEPKAEPAPEPKPEATAAPSNAVRLLKSEVADLARAMPDGPEKDRVRGLYREAGDSEELLRALRSELEGQPAKKGGFAPPRK